MTEKTATRQVKAHIVRFDLELSREWEVGAAEAGLSKVEVAERALRGYLPFLRDQVREARRRG